MTDYCGSHLNARSTGRCAACHRPFCSDCVVEDISANLCFCSVACRQSDQRTNTTDQSQFVAGLRNPIRDGRRLAFTVSGRVSLWVGVPVGLAYGLLHMAAGSLFEDLILVGCFGVGMAGVGLILSDSHTGAAFANPWPRVAARIFPWAATLLFAGIGTLIGSLLIIPGIILGIRLFWADEFALVHRHGPLSAMRASIELTRGLTTRIFTFQILIGLLSSALTGGCLVLLFVLDVPSEASGSAAILVATVTTVLGVIVANLYALIHGPEVVYFYGLRALRSELPAEALRGDWVERALRGSHGRESSHLPLCPACGSAWDPSDYRAEVEKIYCSSCKSELLRPTALRSA